MDIVERLRKWKDSPLFNMADLDSSDMEEAADEIERMRGCMQTTLDLCLCKWNDNGRKSDDQFGVAALLLMFGLGQILKEEMNNIKMGDE